MFNVVSVRFKAPAGRYCKTHLQSCRFLVKHKNQSCVCSLYNAPLIVDYYGAQKFFMCGSDVETEHEALPEEIVEVYISAYNRALKKLIKDGHQVDVAMALAKKIIERTKT